VTDRPRSKANKAAEHCRSLLRTSQLGQQICATKKLKFWKVCCSLAQILDAVEKLVELTLADVRLTSLLFLIRAVNQNSLRFYLSWEYK
jgi:hypothetical protein